MYKFVIMYVHMHTVLSDHDRVSYFKTFFPYFTQLHFVLEQWSRMDFDVKNAMVNYGAFHLLLNELHTAPTAKVCLCI